MSNSVWPHRRQPTRLPRPWDSPGKNTRVGCHFLLQCMKVKSESEVAQSCPTLRDRMDCSPPGSSIHGIFQARVLAWVPLPSPLQDQVTLLCICGLILHKLSKTKKHSSNTKSVHTSVCLNTFPFLSYWIHHETTVFEGPPQLRSPCQKLDVGIVSLSQVKNICSF